MNVMRIFGTALLVLLFFGCARPPQAPEPIAGLEEALIAQLEENAGAFRSLRGMAKVRISAEGRSQGGSQVLLVEEPDRFRAEVLSPFGQPLALIAADGNKLSVLVPGEGRFFTGSATYGNVQRFTRLPLRLEDMIALMLYRVPLLSGGERTLSAEREGYLLTVRGENGLRQELLFDTARRLVRAAWHQEGRLLLRADFGAFTKTAPSYPQSFALSVPDRGVEASVNFTELELNAEVPADRFRLSPPPGYTVEPLP